MNENAKNLSLHPSVTVLPIGNDRLQIRSPFKGDVTFDQDIEFIQSLLKDLDGNFTLDMIIKRHGDNDHQENVARALLSHLDKSGLLVHGEHIANQDKFNLELDLWSRRIKPIFQSFQGTSEGEDYAMDFNKIKILGEGLVSKAVHEMAENLGMNVVETADEKTLVIACNDTKNFNVFRKWNREYVENKTAIVFVYFEGLTFNIGPFVIPGESACMECTYHRKKGSIQFIDEFDAYVQYNASNQEMLDEDSNATLKGFANYASGYLLTMVQKQLYNFLEPGTVYSFNTLIFESKSRLVTRLPRCPVCGTAIENQVLQAVRELA